MHFDIVSLIPILIRYRYLVVFPVAVVEGPIISIVSGFLVSLGYMDFKIAYLVLVVGDLVGDCLTYAVGRFAGKGFIKNFGHLIGINQQRLEKIERYIHSNLKKTFIFGKFAHGLGYITWLACGIVKVPFRKFLAANTLTTLIKSLILITIGYFFGQAYLTFNKYFSYSSYILLGLFVVAYIVLIRTNLLANIIDKID